MQLENAVIVSPEAMCNNIQSGESIQLLAIGIIAGIIIGMFIMEFITVYYGIRQKQQ
ncbi:hypothetical protein M0R72_15315 [Candidatus Pacearchaeota archaeon]|jgi:uncharacterized membrane-anchored protein YhcB (DUF1043 family)|nr:hypothetical protein [Candidatus Pacearchaeota archaeon]